MAALAVSGCGLRPAHIPETVTIQQAIEAIERWSPRIQDYSGRASVLVDAGEGPQTATLLIRYIYPGRFRVYVKGFAGIDLARITALGDSVAVYVPSENLYVTAARGNDLLARLAPDADIDLDGIEFIFDGSLPPPDERIAQTITMDIREREADLTVSKGARAHRYTLAGPALRLVSEVLLVDGEPVVRKKFEKFGTYNGVVFPEELTLERGGTIVKIKFSQSIFNSGLTDRDLLFAVPPSAERVAVE